MRRVANVSSLLLVGLLLPALAAAQTGTISGSVEDATGAVLPGVTVEASSPALIEKVRSVITDAQGVYRIVDLRPGTYSVTFTLPGFSIIKREGLELVSGVTATVNAELRVGSVSETITVTGQSPLVDIQNSSQHRTITTTMFEELPAGRQMANMAVLIPGVYVSAADAQNLQDVGTNSGDSPVSLSIHGSLAREMPLLYDGMRTNSLATTAGGTAASGYGANAGTIQEIAIDTSSTSAEYEVSGVRANIIPKQGGNRLEGYFLVNYANESMSSNNLDDELEARGLPDPTVMRKTWDVNPALGGPLKRDRVWFYGSYRYLGNVDQPPGVYRDKDPNDWVYTPDFTQHLDSTYWRRNGALRITWQTSPNSKLAAYGDDLKRCNCENGINATTTLEAAQYTTAKAQHFYQATWNWTATSRLLFELGQAWKQDKTSSDYQPDTPLTRASATEQTTGVTIRAASSVNSVDANQFNNKAIMSFVTGSHSFKVGAQMMWGHIDLASFSNTDYTVTLSNGEPISATFKATPYTRTTRTRANLGVFAQEQWTRKQLTLNLGLRFDYANAYIPAKTTPAARFVGARSTPHVDNVPDWKDVNPRVGITYDLFGNAKTALKWNIGRYIESVGALIADAVNPVSVASNTSTTRAWTDSNKDFTPQENELAANSNANFGGNTITTSYAPGTVTGWGTRQNNWETMLGVQHELRPGVSLEASYFRRWYGTFRVTDNTLVKPENFDPYFLFAPADPRLPGGGGFRVDGLYNVTPTLFGQNLNSITNSEKFGKQSQIYDGIDLTVNVRLAGGVLAQGGVNSGRTKTNACFAIDSPQALRFCDVRPPFQNNIKLLAIYPLPIWGIQASATYQSLPGPEILATWSAPAAAVQGLGRALAGGARTISVSLIEPGTTFGERLHQTNLRFTKRLRVSRMRIEPQFDIYNLFNANAVLQMNNTYSPTTTSWQQPLVVLPGRLVKVGVQLQF